MKIKVGQKAPPFAAMDIHGNLIRLEDYHGKWLLLSFHRLAACPFCGLRIYSLSVCYPSLHGQGLEIVAFIESTETNTLRQPYAQEAPFPIIADPQQTFYQRYGTRMSRLGRWWADLTRKREIAEAESRGFGSGVVDGPAERMPADFLIGPDSMVRFIHYGRHSGDSLQIKQIKALVEQFAGTPQVSVGVS